MPFVIESGSKQYIVEYGQKIIVDRLTANEGEELEFKVLFCFGDSESIKTVKVLVLTHQKGEKIRVVKFKNKSNYHRQYGYRHHETILQIQSSESKDKKIKKDTSLEDADSIKTKESTTKVTKIKKEKIEK